MNVIGFFLFVLVGEIIYQINRQRHVPFKKVAATMTRQQFEKAVANGDKLVILDDMVLDINKFIPQHPGGKFVLEHTIGRDISKFFYGGYNLEGNL